MITPATHRGVCNRCRRDFVLRADGLLRGHDRLTPDGGKEPCPGSYYRPRKNTIIAIVRRAA